MWIRNDSELPQRGPFFIIKPGQVVEVPDNWIRRRDDRVRRGYFTVVDGPAVVAEPEPEPKKAPKKAPKRAPKRAPKKADE